MSVYTIIYDDLNCVCTKFDYKYSEIREEIRRSSRKVNMNMVLIECVLHLLCRLVFILFRIKD